MRPPPLPLAPRPCPGEAVSSWVRRVASRYDILGDHLVRYVLGRRAYTVHRAERLDHCADAALEDALALATRVDCATIRRLRIVRHDGSASCWHRTTPTWCPACIRGDLPARGEVHERAIWRLGCCVLCPKHGVPLEDTCRRCAAQAPCRFQCAKGQLELACIVCGRRVEAVLRPSGGEDGGGCGIRWPPSVKCVVEELQTDLQAALAGLPPGRSWGGIRSAKGLTIAVRDLTLCIVLAERLKVEPRIELPEPKPGQAYAPIHHPITPAALLSGTAFGVLASVAAVLRTLARGGEGRQRWRPDDGTGLMSAASFVAWLATEERRLLARLAVGWEHPAGHVLRATIAQLENAAGGSGSRGTLRPAA